jgi:5-formyltetrahydrofolate cyclo-ligase
LCPFGLELTAERLCGLVAELLRKKIWDLMENRGIARLPRPVYGRFPNSEGTAQAAERLKEL